MISLLMLATLASATPPERAAFGAEAEAFMAAYARDLNAGDRRAVGARYSAAGATIHGFGPKISEPHAAIAAHYESEAWTPPEAFAWDGLSYEALPGGACVVAGSFLWTTAGKPIRFAYTGVLVREAGAYRIRLEHENPIGDPPRPSK